MVNPIPSVSNRFADDMTFAAPRTTDIRLAHVQFSSLLGEENMSRAQRDRRVIALQSSKATQRSAFFIFALYQNSGNESAAKIFTKAHALFSLLFIRIIFPVMLLKPNS
jgi:hypothetical protein